MGPVRLLGASLRKFRFPSFYEHSFYLALVNGIDFPLWFVVRSSVILHCYGTFG